MQLQLLIWTPYTKISFQLFLVTQLLQNTSLQMANGLLLLDNRIYISSTGDLHICVLQYNHDHILAGHYGQNKILELVHCGYSWPSLWADVQQFCKSCVTYMQSKLQCHKLYRSLKQLPISEWPWNSISMDFIKKLLSSSGFDTIFVIVDWLTKQAIFIPAHDTITSVCSLCVLQTWCFFPCYLWQRLRVCVKLLPFFRHCLLQSQDLRVGQVKELCIRVNTRELNGVPSTSIYLFILH